METQMCENDQNLLPPADLVTEIEKLNESLRVERDRHLRTLADFKNYRRNVEREGNKIAADSKREMMLLLLDIIDDIEKALQYADDADQPTEKGVRVIYRKFLSMLAKHGVIPFESVGTQFNYDLHEAVAMTRHNGTEPGTVVDELRRGYLWNSELLRHAQVRVAG